MANRKTQLMSEFYQKCQQKGYTDMNDSTQSLKAKVIATDLGLNYGNIVTFYNEASVCYEQVCKEKAEAEKKRAEQQKKDEEESRRRAVNGELLLTLSDKTESSGKAQILRVYIRPDNSIYSTLGNGPKKEGAPTIQVKKAGAVYATYHPSEAVYTGATVGGITTGGVHYTKAGYSYTQDNKGKGEITVSVSGNEFVVSLVTISEFTQNKFKRDSQYQLLAKKGRILCCQNTEKADFYANGVALAAKQGNTTLMMNAASMAADERRLPYKKCVEITNLIGRIVHGQFPPSDEEVYRNAEHYSNATNSSDLKRAIDAFNSLGHFQDARQRAQALRPKYEEMLQYEKEQAILRKEAEQKKRKRFLLIPNLFVTAILLLISVTLWTKLYSPITAIFVTISALLSAPGMEKLIFRKKYGFLQKIVRWFIVFVIFFVAFGFYESSPDVSDMTVANIPEAYKTHLAGNIFENDGRTIAFSEDACVTYHFVNGTGTEYRYTYSITEIDVDNDTITMEIRLKEANRNDEITDDEIETMTYNIEDDTVFYYFTYHKQ